MAEKERLTKAERREQKRQERIAEQEQAKAAASRARVRNYGLGALSIVLIGGLVVLAFDNADTEVASDVTLTVAEGEDALQAAGCEAIPAQELTDRTHYEPTTVPPAEQIYTAGRPTNSGPHYARPNGVVDGAANNQLDEYATTHNLEHGSVIVWYDPAQVDGSTVDEIDDWVQRFNQAGFAEENSGAGLFASPYEDPGIDSGKAFALRAWGVSVDCDSWDETAANAFVVDNFGTNGAAPEAGLGPYPTGVLGYSDQSEGEGASEAPGDGESQAPSEQSSQ